MNKQAEGHLRRAEGLFARGDEFYGKAADEIIAAQKADPTLSGSQIGERLGRSKAWVNKVIAWRLDGSAPSPFVEPGRETPDVRGAKRVLRTASFDQIESVLLDLPPAQVSALAGIASKVAHQQHPATAIRPPTGLGKRRSHGFLLEISGAGQRLVEAIDRFVEIWDREAPNATEEELQVERDLLAPKLQSLRMTVEEVVV